MGRKRSTGSRLGLGEPYNGLLVDFCEANRGSPEIRIIREAVQFYVEFQLNDDPKLKERFDIAREKRLSTADQKLKVVLKPGAR